MKKINLDMWYGNRITECTDVDCFFSDADCIYRGNVYINGKPVGDFSSKDSVVIERFMKSFYDRRM